MISALGVVMPMNLPTVGASAGVVCLAVSSAVALEPVTATTRPMASFIARAAEAAETTGEVGARVSIRRSVSGRECSQERPKLMD